MSHYSPRPSALPRSKPAHARRSMAAVALLDASPVLRRARHELAGALRSLEATFPGAGP